MNKIIQVTEDITICSDRLNYIERIKRGDPENPYYEPHYFPTLEDCLEDVYQNLVKKDLRQGEEKDVEEMLKAIKSAKDEIKTKIDSLNDV